MKKVGLSLRFCVLDIVNGEVAEEDVETIITDTDAPDDESWGELMDLYAQVYWAKNKKECVDIANRLREAGKIIQPRTEGKGAPNIASGHWLTITI